MINLEDKVVLTVLHKLEEEGQEKRFEEILKKLIKLSSESFLNAIKQIFEEDKDAEEIALPVLLELLSNQTNLTQILSKNALTQIDFSSNNRILEAINHKNPEVCLEAILIMSQKKNLSEKEQLEFIHTLVKALNNENSIVRSGAITALGKIKLNKKIPIPASLLIRLLADENILVQKWAALALKKLGDDVLPELLEAVKNEKSEVRLSIIHILSQWENQLPPEAISLLLHIIQEENFDVDSFAALEALGLIGITSSEILNTLMALVEKKDLTKKVRNATLKTLGDIGKKNKEVSEKLTPFLENILKEESLKYEASFALMKLGKIKKEYFFLLMTSLESIDEKKAREVQKNIVELGPEGIPFIIESITENTRQAAEKIIYKIFTSILDSLKNEKATENETERVIQIVDQLIEAPVQNQEAHKSSGKILKELITKLIQILNTKKQNERLQKLALNVLQKFAEYEKLRKEAGQKTGETHKLELKEQISKLRQAVHGSPGISQE